MDKDWIESVMSDLGGVTEPLKNAGYTVIENVLFHGRFIGSNGEPISGELRDTYLQFVQMDYGRRDGSVEIPLRHLAFLMRKPQKTLERHLPELVACGLFEKQVRKNGKMNLPTRYIFCPFPVKEVFRSIARLRYFRTLSASNPPIESDEFDRRFDAAWTEVGPDLENRFQPARMKFRQAKAVEQEMGIVEKVQQVSVPDNQARRQAANRHSQPAAVVNDDKAALDYQVAERIGLPVTITLTNRVAKWRKSHEEPVILAAVDHAVGGAGSKSVTLNWIDTILADWQRQSVRTTADVECVINDYRAKRRQQREVKAKREKPTAATGAVQRAPAPKESKTESKYHRFVDREMC